MIRISTFSRLPLFAAALFLASCQPDDNDPVDDTDGRENYTGTWKCSENSQQFGQTNYDVNILKSAASADAMTIENFYQFGFSSEATITLNASNGTLTLPLQSVSGHTVSGTGQKTSSSTISWNYIVNDGAVDDTVSATYTRP